MTKSQPISKQIKASVQEVMPAIGLAYALDDERRTWGITRSTKGVGLASLSPGQRIELTVVSHQDFDLVHEYATLN